ncbi:MAG: DUF3631 domain-containing protein, partial [Betaproteobacteria bacterium]|nr:DUF3631 domain-containing protein [Betaproteobacteria bacterium]
GDPLEETFKRLAALTPTEYELCRRAEAKRLCYRYKNLDFEVSKRRKSCQQAATDGFKFDDVNPWHEHVDGAALLSDIATTIQRFIICKPETAHAAALWVVFTWFIEVVQFAPILMITAPEKRCGKSQLLELHGKLSCRPILASNITPASTFRVIDAWKPTLLIDEADTFMDDPKSELRGILNSGHTRDSAYVIRTVGDDHTPKQFSTWGAKAVAGIGKRGETLMDRSIIIELRRKLKHEAAERLRYAEPGLFDELRSRICRFATDRREAVQCARPSLPQSLNDRAQDNWEPLIAIADVAGGIWPELARKAALLISGSTDESTSISNELLADIAEVFEARHLDRISTKNLIVALCDDEEKSWAIFNRGKWITPKQIARRLKEYGITSKTIREGYGTSKGYELEQFRDAFSRYLPPPPLSIRHTVTTQWRRGFWRYG